MNSPTTSNAIFVLGAAAPRMLTIEDLPSEAVEVQRVSQQLRGALAELGLGFLLPEEFEPVSEAPGSPIFSSGHELAVALLLMARVLGRSVRPGVLAWGALGARGSVLPSPGASLAQSARQITSEGAIQAVLLSRHRADLSQPSDAEGLASLLPVGVRVLGVQDLAQALEEALGLMACARDGAFPIPSSRKGTVVERLFRSALDGVPPGLGWGLVGALCSGLLLRNLDDEMLRWKASFARDVARRHGGDPVLIRWPEEELLEAFPREIRLGITAHLVQSASDGDPSQAEDYEELAWPMVSKTRLLPADARLLGALGRSEAARGLYSEAAATLGRAVEAWTSLGLREDSSYPLCERLRVLGILGEKGGVLPLVEGPVDAFLNDSGCSIIGKTFVQLAAARALVQVGEPGLACARLLPQGLWDQALEHVATSRLRWLATAQRATGQPGEARSTVETLAHHGDTDQLYLARLDEALEGEGVTPEVVEGHAQALLEATQGGAEARNLLERLAPWQPLQQTIRDRAIVARLAREYRY